ncbi:translation initiation factor eIF 4e-like domain-containing protein [Catenaria anguillulae PL171]|uniref:Translation initiation factor eIF 4e-like domain-containing protein n=1 Tax=Catenaria anguillulae PL171 TaxID=765915 RepID=A0A1Y2HHP0_9FUNG|nr:translation initiation factor eIF 4e-like domain-containing protein [Catenaria anguillulae PL171]
MPANAQNSHPLAHTWTVYYSFRKANERITNYEDAIKRLVDFGTVEEFWSTYSHLKRPADLEPISDYHIFRSGIRPMWEVPENINGGKFIIRLRKDVSQRFWEDLILAVVGNQFPDPVNGIVLSIRTSEDILSVWTADSTPGMSDTLKLLLQLPEAAVIEYKEHNDSLRDKSSFRNTDVFK